MGDNGIVSPQELKNLRALREAEEVYECASGRRYKLRGMESREFYGALQSIPDLTALGRDNDGAAPDPVLVQKRMESIVAAGLLEPRVGDGEDCISIADIPHHDLFELGNRICVKQGMTREASEALRPTPAGAIS